MKRRVYLHTSDIRRFKACRRQWRYASPLGYNKAPLKTPAALARGKVWHPSFERLYMYGEDPVEVFCSTYHKMVDKERRNGAYYSDDEVAEALRVGTAVLSMYPAWAKKHDNFKVIEAERRYSVPLAETADVDIWFTFRCDQIVENKYGLWIHDFKTVATLPEDTSFLDFDEQITGYLKGCELYFKKPFAGAIFTYILAKEPTEPEPLKRGGLSRNKQIYTTPAVYYRKLLELGEDPRDYQEFLQSLNARCHWFRRFEILKTSTEKEILWQEHQQLALEMVRPDVFIYKAPKPLDCLSCSFKSPCLAENNGDNFELILQNEFINAEEW